MLAQRDKTTSNSSCTYYLRHRFAITVVAQLVKLALYCIGLEKRQTIVIFGFLFNFFSNTVAMFARKKMTVNRRLLILDSFLCENSQNHVLFKDRI